MLQITQRRQEGTLIAVYTGELDHHAARAAIEQTEDLLVLFPCEKLVLDLSELTFMDSSGLAVVLHLYRTCARSGREFAVRGTPPQPMRVIEAAGLPHVMSSRRASPCSPRAMTRAAAWDSLSWRHSRTKCACAPRRGRERWLRWSRC